MTHGQIHAALAARKLSPEQAADIVIKKQTEKSRGIRRSNPFVLLCMFVLACVASALGIKSNESA